jgi:uncharacterized protein (DUF2384 family)
MRAVEPSKAHVKRLKVVKTTLHGRGGEISRDSVAAHALDTFGSPEKAERWLNRPNPLFEGKAPK